MTGTAGETTGVNPVHVRTIQALALGLVLSIWEFGPKIPSVQDAFPFMDPFFISSPASVIARLFDMVRGVTEPNVWSLLLTSGRGIALGALTGLGVGMILGLILSHWPRVDQVASPFLTALNATPRLALIPIFIIVLGPNQRASIAVSAFIVFLVTFFSALAGGRSVPTATMLHAHLLGATELGLLRIRWRYAAVWTFAVLPNVLSTAFIAGLMTELLSGAPGLGRLVRQALERLDSTSTMALVIFLSIIGGALSRLGRVYARWRLHWAPTGAGL